MKKILCALLVASSLFFGCTKDLTEEVRASSDRIVEYLNDYGLSNEDIYKIIATNTSKAEDGYESTIAMTAYNISKSYISIDGNGFISYDKDGNIKAISLSFENLDSADEINAMSFAISVFYSHFVYDGEQLFNIGNVDDDKKSYFINLLGDYSYLIEDEDDIKIVENGNYSVSLQKTSYPRWYNYTLYFSKNK